MDTKMRRLHGFIGFSSLYASHRVAMILAPIQVVVRGWRHGLSGSRLIYGRPLKDLRCAFVHLEQGPILQRVFSSSHIIGGTRPKSYVSFSRIYLTPFNVVPPCKWERRLRFTVGFAPAPSGRKPKSTPRGQSDGRPSRE